MVRLVRFINPLSTGSEKSKCRNTWQSSPSGNHVMIQQIHFWTSDLAIFSFFQHPGLSQKSKPTQHGEMGSISTASCSFSTAMRHVRSVSWLNCLRRQFALYHCLLFILVFLFYNCSVHALVCLFNFVYSLLIFVIDFVYILFFVCSLLIFVLFCMYCICSFMSTSTTYYLLIWLLLFTYFTVASLCFYTKQNLLH